MPALRDEVRSTSDDAGPPPPPVAREQPQARPTPAPTTGLRSAGVVVGAIGLVALAGGSVSGILALSTESAANELCPTRVCTTKEGYDKHVQASTEALASTILFGVGAVAVAAGVTLFVLAPPSTSPTGARALVRWRGREVVFAVRW